MSDKKAFVLTRKGTFKNIPLRKIKQKNVWKLLINVESEHGTFDVFLNTDETNVGESKGVKINIYEDDTDYPTKSVEFTREQLSELMDLLVGIY